MAIVKCKECDSEVSETASICLHCGISHPGVTTKQGCIAVVIGMLLVVGLVIWVSSIFPFQAVKGTLYLIQQDLERSID